MAIVAPAGPVPRDAFERGVARLAGRYALAYDERIFERTGFFAGSDEARGAELQAALDAPEVRAVVCARGGYGIMRLLPRLDPAGLRAAPKPVVGFSDVTALHAFCAWAGVVSVHGPVVTQLGALDEADAAALIALLEGAPPAPVTGLETVVPGVAEGRLLGGNLEVLTRLVGTPWQPPLDGAIWLLEDVGERPYRVDRQLTQLALAGLRPAGVVLGDFVRCLEPDGSPPTVEEVLVERLGRLGVPVVRGAPVGHGTRNRALPHGARVRLDATAGILELLDGAVR